MKKAWRVRCPRLITMWDVDISRGYEDRHYDDDDVDEYQRGSGSLTRPPSLLIVGVNGSSMTSRGESGSKLERAGLGEETEVNSVMMPCECRHRRMNGLLT